MVPYSTQFSTVAYVLVHKLHILFLYFCGEKRRITKARLHEPERKPHKPERCDLIFNGILFASHLQLKQSNCELDTGHSIFFFKTPPDIFLIFFFSNVQESNRTCHLFSK